MGRRRGFLAAALSALALSACWPGPNNNPDRTGHNPFESTLTTATVGGLTQRWDIAGGRELVAVGGAVYQNTALPDGSWGVRRLQAATGATVWDVALTTPQPSPFGTTEHLSSIDGSLVVPYINGFPARNPSSGTVTLDPDDGTVTGGAVVSAGFTTVRKGRILTTRAGTVMLGVPPLASYVVSDRATGTVITSAIVKQNLDANDAFLYTLGEEVLLISVGGVDQPDGTVASELRSVPVAGTGASWTAPLPGASPTSAVVDVPDGVLHVGTAEGQVVTVDAATGAVLWTADVGGAVTQLPALADGNLYVSTGAGELVVLDAGGCGATTCTPSWRAALTGAGPTQPAIGGAGDGAVVYVAMAAGGLAAFPAAGCGAATCEPLWTGSVAGSITHGPIVSGGQVYVTTDADRLVAFGLP